MRLEETRKLIENPPETCLGCPCNKQVRFGEWSALSICKLTNIKLNNYDYQKRAKHCPFEVAKSKEVKDEVPKH